MCSCKPIRMEGEDDEFLGNILLNGQEAHVAGLDEMEIPNTQDSTLVDEVKGSRTTKGGRRSKNFQIEEDEVVCKGWLAVSKDQLHGAYQSRTTFWGKVHAYYDDNNETRIPRTESSIMHRWLVIQLQVNKFCSCYEAIVRRNQSGTNTQDKV